MAQLIWAPSALKDIDLIARYISKDSVQAAENIVHLFFEKAEVLAKHPAIGKPVPEISSPIFREILVNRYRLIYELISPGEVHIITVHHQSRMLKNNPAYQRIIPKQ